jgi:hypothetical protein
VKIRARLTPKEVRSPAARHQGRQTRSEAAHDHRDDEPPNAMIYIDGTYANHNAVRRRVSKS